MELLPNGTFKHLQKYPNMTFVLPVEGDVPVICSEPNLSKQNFAVAYCTRHNKTDWKIEDTWEKIRPILCDNYLIEENSKYNGGNKSKAQDKIVVREIEKGKEINSRSVLSYQSDHGFRFLRCSENRLIIGTADKIHIVSVPEVKDTDVSDCGVPEPRDAILVSDTVYWINGNGEVESKSIKMK